MNIEADNHERYFQCPYCNGYTGGHEIRVPKTIGKYRVKIIYGNILIFICSKCGRTFKIEIIPEMYLWEYMKKKQKENFKKLKGGKLEYVKNV